MILKWQSSFHNLRHVTHYLPRSLVHLPCHLPQWFWNDNLLSIPSAMLLIIFHVLWFICLMTFLIEPGITMSFPFPFPFLSFFSPVSQKTLSFNASHKCASVYLVARARFAWGPSSERLGIGDSLRAFVFVSVMMAFPRGSYYTWCLEKYRWYDIYWQENW